MSTMQLTNIHLRPAQKKALQQRAKANGSNVAAEIRNAVDAYLAGVTADELALLDAATKNTETLLAAMNEMLDDVNHRAERIFAEMARLRGGDPESLFK